MNLLTLGNHKTEKGRSRGYLTAVLHLAPGKLAGRGNVCPFASGGRNGCLRCCLNLSGRGPMWQAVRKERTRLMFDRPRLFSAGIVGDLAELVRQAEKERMAPAVRLNATSDVDWHQTFPEIMEAANALGVVAYDYTKVPGILARAPRGYDVTFSWSGTNEAETMQALRDGHRVAVPFRGPALPSSWRGYPVIDGDADDLRFLDPRGVVVGLLPKGSEGKRAARETRGGFFQ